MRKTPGDWVSLFKPIIPGLAVVLLLQILAGSRYGLFRDELYYLSNSKMPAWGYVDHPPLSVWLLRLWTSVFWDGGTSVRALSLTVSLLSVVAVGFLTWDIYHEGRSVLLASLAVAAMPVLRVVGTLYSPNTLEVLLWAVTVLAWRRAMLREAGWDWRWLLVGLLLGMAILNRLSGFWLAAALLVCTAVWDWRRFRFAWVGVLPCVVMLAPWVMWQREHAWATLEFARNANTYKLLPVSPWQFVATQIAVANPVVAILWVGALTYGWRDRLDRPLIMGFCAVAVILLVNGRSRENYLSPAYVFVLPVGAHLMRDRARWLAPLIGATGVLFGLICLPILPAPVLARVLGSLPSPPSAEKGPKSALQGLGDTIGWPEMAMTVSKVWEALPAATRSKAALMTANYGEAAALEYYGPAVGLPQPICAHNEYWLRGYGNWDGQTLVFVGAPRVSLTENFTSVKLLGRMDSPLSVPEEANAGIWLMSGGRESPSVLWTRLKEFQ